MAKLRIISTKIRSDQKEKNQDSSKKKRVSSLMRERFLSLVDAESHPVGCWLPDTTLTFANQAYCDLIGQEKKFILGKKWMDFMPKEIRFRSKKVYAALVKEPSRHRFEYSIRRKNGDLRYIEWIDQPVFGQKGELKEFVSIGRDITQNKKKENDLMESENRYQQLVSSMNDGLIVQNEKGIVTYVNSSFLKNTDTEERQWMNKSVLELKKDQQEIADILIAQKKNFKESRCDLRDLSVKRKKSGATHLEITAVPILSKSGDFQGGFLVASDVSSQKRIEERLRKITDCILRLGFDANKNIQSLTSLFGEIIGASCVLYNRLEDDSLCVRGHWQMPKGYTEKDKAEGHICYDVIADASDHPVILEKLDETEYYFSDPGVARYKWKTYIGQAIKSGDRYMGSLCALFEWDFIPSKDDLKVMGILAAAIGSQESHRKNQVIIELKMNFQQLISRISSRFVGNFNFDDSIERSLVDLQKITNSSGAHLFMNEEKNIRQVFSWKNNQIKIGEKNIKTIPAEKFSWWLRKMSLEGVLKIDKSIKFPKMAVQQWKSVTGLQISNVLIIPVLAEHRAVGFIVLEEVKENIGWSFSDTAFLKIAGEILGKAVEIRNSEKELLQVLEKAKKAKKEWEITVDSLPQIICLLGKKGSVIRINKAIETWKLGNVRSSRGSDLHDILHKNCSISNCQLKKDLKAIWKKTQNGEISEIIHENSRTRKTICVKIHPLSGDGSQSGYAAMAVIYDITDKIKSNQRNLEMFKYLGRINRRIAVLLGVSKQNFSQERVNVYTNLTRSALDVAEAKASFLFLYDGKKRRYDLVSRQGEFLEEGAGKLADMAGRRFGFLDKIEKREVRIQGFSQEKEFKYFHQVSGLKKTTNAFLVLPLFQEKKISGILILGFNKKQKLSTQELDFYELFSAQAGIVLGNIQNKVDISEKRFL